MENQEIKNLINKILAKNRICQKQSIPKNQLEYSNINHEEYIKYLLTRSLADELEKLLDEPEVEETESSMIYSRELIVMSMEEFIDLVKEIKKYFKYY